MEKAPPSTNTATATVALALPIPIRHRSWSLTSVPTSCPNKIIFALVGLPARGKSFLASKIVSFFQWSGTSARIFNVGSKRRDMEGATKSGRATFFSNTDASAVSKRDNIALATLDEAIHWLLHEDGCIALFDATNTTQARRQLIKDRLAQEYSSFNLIFIESICTSEAVLQNNLRQKIRHSPDFNGISEDEALVDIRARISEYECVYEPVSDEENVAYIKVIDFASKVYQTLCLISSCIILFCLFGMFHTLTQ
jgi:predicted kinase